MQCVDSQDADVYRNLAELARANVSGLLGYGLVRKAQHRLVNKMRQAGLVSPEDTYSLKM